jgi:hypothetical protein
MILQSVGHTRSPLVLGCWSPQSRWVGKGVMNRNAQERNFLDDDLGQVGDVWTHWQVQRVEKRIKGEVQ